jgi:hypothetical protein
MICWESANDKYWKDWIRYDEKNSVLFVGYEFYRSWEYDGRTHSVFAVTSNGDLIEVGKTPERLFVLPREGIAILFIFYIEDWYYRFRVITLPDLNCYKAEPIKFKRKGSVCVPPPELNGEILSATRRLTEKILLKKG